MTVNLLIESIRANCTSSCSSPCTILHADTGATKLSVYQVERGTTINYDEDGYPINVTRFQEFTLPNTNANGTMPFNGFGPAVSYRSHGCLRATQFTFSNLDMAIIGDVEIPARTFNVVYHNGLPEGVPAGNVTNMPSPNPDTKTEWVDKPLPGVRHPNLSNPVNIPANPQRSGGYIFLGWSYGEDNYGVPLWDHQPGDNIPDAPNPREGQSALTINMTAMWQPPPRDSLYDFLNAPDVKSMFRGAHTNFVIDLFGNIGTTSEPKTDRVSTTFTRDGQTQPELNRALEFMKNPVGAGLPSMNIKYIAIRDNAILDDGAIANPNAWETDANGKTIRPATPLSAPPTREQLLVLWRDIAEYIVAMIPNCIDGVTFRGDDVIVFGFEDWHVNPEVDPPANAVPRCSHGDTACAAGNVRCVQNTAWNNEGWKTPYADYISALHAYKSDATGYAQLPDDPGTGFEINLTKETITTRNFEIAAFRLGGPKGQKWRQARKGFDDRMLARLLNKGMTLEVADTWIAKPIKNDKEAVKAGGPKNLQNRGVPEGDGSEPRARIAQFGTINGRPRVTVRFAVNYGIYPDMTGITSGGWALASRDDAKKPLAALMATDAEGVRTAALIDGWQVGIGEGKEKAPIAPGYGFFCKGVKCAESNIDCKGMGIPVKVLEGSKPERLPYFIRMAPVFATTDVSVTYTPASRARRVNALSELRAPKYKLRVVEEKTKTDKKTDVTSVTREPNKLIKLKLGDNVFPGNLAALRAPGRTLLEPTAISENVKTGTPLQMSASDAPRFLTVTGKGAVISTQATNSAALPVVTIWRTASGRRPASQKLEVENPANPSSMPASTS
jgi:hypothetical protein